MEKMFTLRFWGSFLVLALFVAGALTLMRDHTSAHASTKSVIVSSSGLKLATLFEGLPRDPRYSVEDILATRRALPRCGKKQSTLQDDEKASVLQSILSRAKGSLQSLFGNTVVYAQCFITQCGGTGWVSFTDSCNTGEDCSGDYNNVTTDANSDLGEHQVSTHCGGIPACGCESQTC
jgi:hypothetical protein